MSGLLATRIRIATMLAVSACLLGCLLAGNGVAHAATTRTWLGGSGANWSTAANWSPAGAPANGDALKFPASAGTKTTVNDLVGLDVASLEFAGTSYSVGGNAMKVDSSIAVDQADSATIAVPVTIGGPLPVTVGRFALLKFTATPLSIDTNGFNLTFQGDGEADISGAISGSGNVAVLGTAAVVYEAAMSYTGTTTVGGGILALDSASIGPPGVTAVEQGGAFGGTGSTGPLTLTGSLLYPGINGVIGSLSVPSLSLDLGSTARFRLNDSSLDGNDEVFVHGPVDLGGALLDLRWALEPTVGDQFTLIAAATSLTGTFAGLPEGAVFGASDRRFSITYKGGAGHDVVVTRLPAPPVDLSITDTPSAATFSPGQAVTYTLVVTNKGPSDAPIVMVTTDLPAGLGFQSVSAPAGYTCALPLVGESGQVKCNGGPALAAGASLTMTVVAMVLDGAPATIVAPAAVASGGMETASNDNATTATITVAGGAKPFHLRPAMVAAD